MKKLLPGAAVACILASPSLAADAAIDVGRIARDIQVLSSDEFEGRGPATAGEKKTVAYLIEQMKNAGLEPGGDLKGGTRAWTQDVPLSRSVTKGAVTATVRAGGETQTWTQGEQIAIRASQVSGNRLTIKDAPVVFVGYGVTAPERNWDDFKGYDLKGKVALVLVNDPDFETGQGDFGGKAMTYYGRWTYKFEEAARQGAVGFLVIHETAPASYGWATVKNSNTNEIFDVIRKNPREAHAPLEGWIQRDNAVDLFRKAGLDFEAAKKQAQTRAFRPLELKGVTFSTDHAIDAQTVVSKNVVGMVRGKSRPNERVFYTGHWDHEGISLPDAKGDRIYNGAVDNASGTAALLELGRAFVKSPRPERSVVFLAVTAEEKGLLGSEYYASNPLYPLATTVGVLNMDGMNVVGPTKDVSMSGDAPLTLRDDLIAAAKTKGLYFSPDTRPEAGSFYRSDHFPFAKKGVPAISFGAGDDLVKGGKTAGEAAAAAYIRDRYHQAADEYDPNWDFTGFKQEVELFYDLGWKLANSRTWPEWKPGAEFKAERDKTRAQRK
ncbi:M28 family metallopeptidase [Phenylobacterium sp.]|jgi:Zn-dependent M28 family amino/carboxypeptidase|uniref:M28 family metallopeptidase n=1 Tax=Phenylobacterium sp. TaxID=1871053 RepID=UPI002F94A9A0